jgi:hypothetical protein
MIVADDQTSSAPDESATGVAATMAAPETADGQTAVIAPSDAVTPLAWSQEEVASEDVIPYPDTGAVEAPPGDTGWGWAVVALALAGASLAVVMSVSVLRAHAHDAQSQTTTAAAPTRGALIEITEPPSTVAAPTVTITEAPSTAPVKRPTWATPPDDMFITLLSQTADGWTVPASDRARTIAEGRNVCTQLRAGTSSQAIIDTTAARQGLSWDSANTFVSASITAFCRDKAGSN